ncbi:L,D-transpeptidase family protein [Allosphingosinicella vermicomposti]|uniref:L,D-transpeptidase family protein n=1 Tax=Allosphingosinicella vermicomposti TaxID=614671 RepID=UPI00131A548B|nr:L,D-transpeptidase family protein [Allosphingosinicella vermicomposti]
MTLTMFHCALALALSLIATPAAARDIRPIEPVEIPPSVQQGIDMIYIDPEIAPAMRERDGLLKDLGLKEVPGAPVDLFLPVHPLYTELRRGLMRYRMDWAGLPQVEIDEGPTLKLGMTGDRVALLRERLGLPAGDRFDAALGAAVRKYQGVHGLKADGVAGAGTIASLNKGAEYYERLLLINLERARVLPRASERDRYILVDAGEARLYLYEDGKVRDSMKVIVGSAETPTPMMAALMRFASVNPYWNVPPDLVQTLIAPKVVANGLPYLEEREYEILSDWTEAAEIVDPASIDWATIAKDGTTMRFRRRPGPWNSMGRVKFMMPNDYGIYLHDTPDKSLFNAENRWISNGCVRVEDAERLATWLFGHMPQGGDPKVEHNVDLDRPVPVYITYMTAGVSGDGVTFRKDPYDRDPALIARLFDETETVIASN